MDNGDGISLNMTYMSVTSTDYVLADITAIMRHCHTVVAQKSYKPYGGFNFNYLFITSVCLLIVSHIVTGLYWAICLRNGTTVRIAALKDRA